MTAPLTTFLRQQPRNWEQEYEDWLRSQAPPGGSVSESPGTVTLGPVQSIGTPLSEVQRVEGERGVADLPLSIAGALAKGAGLERIPAPAIPAPNPLRTAADLFTGRVASEGFSDLPGAENLKRRLEEFTRGGGDASANANLFAAADAAGAALGSVWPYLTMPGLPLVARAGREGWKQLLARIGQNAIRGGITGAGQMAAVRGTGGALVGDEQAGPGLAAVGRQAAGGAELGAAGGAAIGGGVTAAEGLIGRALERLAARAPVLGSVRVGSPTTCPRRISRW